MCMFDLKTHVLTTNLVLQCRHVSCLSSPEVITNIRTVILQAVTYINKGGIDVI